MKTKIFGFTLIELMITVAIVGILLAIAVPSYQNAVLQGRRAEGRAALLSLMQQQERYMTQHNCYLGFTSTAAGGAIASAPSPVTACGGVIAPNVPFKFFSGDTLANSAYLLSAGTCDATGGGTLSIAECVRVIASPMVAGSDPRAGDLRLTSTGVKDCTGTTSSTASVCWK